MTPSTPQAPIAPVSSVSLPERLALVQRTLPELDSDLALQAVRDLVDPLRRAGRTAELEGLLDQLAAECPEAYREHLAPLLVLRVENALLLQPRGPLPALRPLARCAEQDLPGFLALLDRLRFHDRLADVAVALREAWPALRRSAALLPAHGDDTLDDLRQVALFAILDCQLATPGTPATVGSLSNAMAPFLDEDGDPDLDLEADEDPDRDRDRDGIQPLPALIEALLDDHYPRGERPFTAADFHPAAAAPRRALRRLSGEFAAALYGRFAWSRSRADLARDELLRYFAFRQRPDEGRTPKRRPPQVPALLPEIQSVEDYLGMKLMSPHPHPHRLAALVAALPFWVRTLAERRLCELREASALARPLREVAQLLTAELDLVTFDPALLAQLAQATRTEIEAAAIR
jgi:hypothetical protein